MKEQVDMTGHAALEVAKTEVARMTAMTVMIHCQLVSAGLIEGLQTLQDTIAGGSENKYGVKDDDDYRKRLSMASDAVLNVMSNAHSPLLWLSNYLRHCADISRGENYDY